MKIRRCECNTGGDGGRGDNSRRTPAIVFYADDTALKRQDHVVSENKPTFGFFLARKDAECTFHSSEEELRWHLKQRAPCPSGDAGRQELRAPSVRFCLYMLLISAPAAGSRRDRRGALWYFSCLTCRWRRQMMEFADKSPLTRETVVCATEMLDYATAALAVCPLLLR